jgi:PqqD family protein of HPr-rel-A system
MNPDANGSPGRGVARLDVPLGIVPLPVSHVRRWQDDLVVYDQRCGETHLLQGIVATLFEWLREGPCTAATLVARLAAAGVEGIDDPESFVNQVLQELQRLQLLEVGTVSRSETGHPRGE